MEGAPHSIEDREGMQDWRELKQRAPKVAQEQIDAIDGYMAMGSEQKIGALHILLDQLADETDPRWNDNRFVAQEVARELGIIEEEERHALRMAALGVDV